jgi:ABC-2 family transporter protein
MIWLTWRQFRASAAMTAAALAVLAVILAVTGPGLADEYSSGIAACASQGADCSNFLQNFFRDHRDEFQAVTAVVLVVPALIGLFWGAPLIARELETGTHRLVWNQSVTRTRWLALKLGLVGLATITAAGLASLAVDWWSDPLDEAAAGEFPRMEPLLFGTRGVVPIAYAAFAFALGVTVGMLVRRTLAAMAITLAVFVAVQVAMPQLVRPHLIAPVVSTIDPTPSSLNMFSFGPDGLQIRATLPDDTGAWVLSSRTIDASGHTVTRIPSSSSLSPTSGPCQIPEQEAPAAPAREGPGDEIAPCLAEVKRLGYRQQVTYQPSSRFWRLQLYESAIYGAFALGLAGFCFWRLRRVS